MRKSLVLNLVKLAKLMVPVTSEAYRQLDHMASAMVMDEILVTGDWTV